MRHAELRPAREGKPNGLGDRRPATFVPGAILPKRRLIHRVSSVKCAGHPIAKRGRADPGDPRAGSFSWSRCWGFRSADEEGCDDHRHDAHHLDQDVERGASRVLEGVADGVADDGCVVALFAALATRANEA